MLAEISNMDNNELIREFEYLFELNGVAGKIIDSGLIFGDYFVPVRNGIPRFTQDISYSSGNFSLLRENHACLQLDSRNGTTDRMDTILNRTGWPPHFFKGKLILECGCGAGPDTEILRSLGAIVISVDIAGLDVCKENIGQTKNGCFIQADITDLPFKRGCFDIVFCHRVLQHTPNPKATLGHILQFVRPGGAVFVHSYARTVKQMLRWKYFLRPISKRINSEWLYKAIAFTAPALFRFTNWLYKLPYGRRITFHFVPFLNYRNAYKFEKMPDATIIEYGIHDTFDALSPKYDNPIGATAMYAIASKYLDKPFEVVGDDTITLLRTVLPGSGPRFLQKINGISGKYISGICTTAEKK